MTREIPLGGRDRLVALVSDEDFPMLSTGGAWHVGRGRNGKGAPYAVRTRWEGKVSHGERMHRLVLPGVANVDHVNGNTLDNRRENLRPSTPSQNAANRRQRSDSRQPFKGIARSVMPAKPWLATITVNGRYVHLGVFECAEDAARAYDAAALTHFGEFARLNFPKEHSNV